MMNLTTPQGSTKPGDGKDKQQAGGYKSRLDQILAQAGSNNPIAAAQAKNQPKASTKDPTTGQITPQPAATMAPTAPPAPAAPQDPNQKLQQILAMAGQTPAQRAQSQAQAAQMNSLANIQAMINSYMQALSQDARKVLKCDIEFSVNPGANDDVYFRCYVGQNNIIYWDVFGQDISHLIPNRIANYALYDDYYKGVPDSDFQSDMATATVHSHQIV